MLRTRLIALALFSLFVFGPILAQGGDVNNPEVLDLEGDSKSGKTSRDILWAYVGHEQNDTVNVAIGLASLETFTDPSDIMNFPVTDYKIYFTVLGVNYVAVATVPVHGPFGIDIQYELRTVTYNGTGPANETQKAGISNADYDPVNAEINMTIQKSDLGNPNEGDLAENIWAATYSRQRVNQFELSDPELEDRAPNQGYGKAYIFRGSVGNEIIRIQISTQDQTSANLSSILVTLKFEIQVLNNGTQGHIIEMNATQYEGWSIGFGSQRTFTLDSLESTNVTLSVRIANPREVQEKGNEEIHIQVVAETNVGNETNPDRRQSNYLTFRVSADLPPPKEEEKTWQEQLQEFWDEHGTNLTYAIVAIIVLVVVLVVVSYLRGSPEEDEFKDVDVKLDDKGKAEATKGK